MTNDAYSVTADELRAFIERIEEMNIEKADSAEQTKGVFDEAKGRGYSAPRPSSRAMFAILS